MPLRIVSLLLNLQLITQIQQLTILWNFSYCVEIHPSLHVSSHPSIHFKHPLRSDLKVTGIFWSLSSQSGGGGRVTTWTRHQCIADPHRETRQHLQMDNGVSGRTCNLLTVRENRRRTIRSHKCLLRRPVLPGWGLQDQQMTRCCWSLTAESICAARPIPPSVCAVVIARRICSLDCICSDPGGDNIYSPRVEEFKWFSEYLRYTHDAIHNLLTHTSCVCVRVGVCIDSICVYTHKYMQRTFFPTLTSFKHHSRGARHFQSCPWNSG